MCPHTNAPTCWVELQHEPWLAAVLAALERAGLAETVSEVEVAPGEAVCVCVCVCVSMC